MSTVLPALDASPSANQCHKTARAIATLLGATATTLHSRENGTSDARELSSGGGIELRGQRLHG
jgi:hypothetical protein